MQIPWIQESRLSQIFTGRRGGPRREDLTAYLMLAPGLLLIFTFGIFPVGFALYVSLHKWLIVRDDFRGLANYVDIIDNLAYFGVFALGIGALIGAALLARRVQRQSRVDRVNPWPLAVPAAFHAAAVLAFMRWFFFQLPEFLDIAPKMRGLERTRELFMGLLSEAFYADTVFPSWQQFVRLLLMALVLGIGASLWLGARNNLRDQVDLTLGWLSAASGLGLLYLAFTAVGQAYAAAVQTGEDPGIWPQLIAISSGVLLLILAWLAWRSPAGQPPNRQSAVRILAATVLMGGAPDHRDPHSRCFGRSRSVERSQGHGLLLSRHSAGAAHDRALPFGALVSEGTRIEHLPGAVFSALCHAVDRQRPHLPVDVLGPRTAARQPVAGATRA